MCQFPTFYQNSTLSSGKESEVLEGYCGRGKIWPQNIAMWVWTEEMERPILSSVLAQYVDKSPSIETKEVNHPRSPKSEHSLEGFKQVTWTKRQNTEEGLRDVQVKKKGNIHVKYPLPPHSIHCTNLAGRINSRVTFE